MSKETNTLEIPYIKSSNYAQSRDEEIIFLPFLHTHTHSNIDYLLISKQYFKRRVFRVLNVNTYQ